MTSYRKLVVVDAEHRHARSIRLPEVQDPERATGQIRLMLALELLPCG